MRRSAVVLLVVLVFVFVLSFAIARWGTTFLLWVFGAIALWFLLSIKIVGPAEMAVLVISGKPVDFRDSGLRFVPFVPWFEPPLVLCYLAKYPKKMFNLDYQAREVVSQAGKYKGVPYGSQVLKVDAVAYLNFPREIRRKVEGEAVDDDTHPLIKILRNHIPTKDEALKDWTEEAVVGALRVAFGKMTWQQAVEDIETLSKEAETVFTTADGALIKAGFAKKGIRLVVTEIHLPLDLEKALPLVDRQRLEAQAAPFEAEQRAEETIGAVIQMMAKTRGKKPEEIMQEIDGDENLRKEFLDIANDLITRRMAIDGQSFVDIRVGGAEGLETTLLDLLAAWKRMPTGATGAGEKKVVISKEAQKRRDEEALKKAIP